MTLQPYRPDQLDQIALQLLDLAGVVREMAVKCRDHEVNQVDLHTKKADEWIGRLNEWAAKSVRDLELRILRDQGTRQAAATTRKPRRRGK